MLIIGARGFAKEILEILHQKEELEKLVFYDDITIDDVKYLYDQFPLLKNKEAAHNYFNMVDNRFTIGIGNPHLRKKLHDDFISIGGVFTSTISLKTDIGSYGITIGEGCNILSGAILSNDVSIGKGCIIYYNCVITHDVTVGDFVEISPNVTLLGNVEIGSVTQIGASTTILPSVKIGKNVIIGGGSVVTKDIPDNTMVYGVPAKVIKDLDPLEF